MTLIIWLAAVLVSAIILIAFLTAVVQQLWREMLVVVLFVALIWGGLAWFIYIPFETHRAIADWIVPVGLCLAPFVWGWTFYCLWQEWKPRRFRA